METNLKQLRLADWDALERDVSIRVMVLKDLVFQLPFCPASDKIANELILPNLELLADFIARVDIEEEEDEEADETKG